MAATMPTLAERYSSSSNGFGLVRLSLTVGVLVAHSWPIGFGTPPIGLSFTHGQIDVGNVWLKGFFLVSGFLITASVFRVSGPRFVWCRLLRVFPGFWVCLLVTAFVFGPVAAYLENGTVAGYWTHPDGPLRYLAVNVFTAMDQYPISGLLSHTPFGRLTGGPSGFDGSLWTLHYELALYALTLVLSVTAILARARRAVLLLTIVFFGLTVRDVVTTGDLTFHPIANHVITPVPLLGSFAYSDVLYLGFMFLLGSSLYLYRDRVPMHGRLAALAAVGALLTLAVGGFYAVGLPCYAYLIVYAAVALPDRLRRIGRRHDYSFGIYIYAFPIQQLLALGGATRWGPLVYLALTMAVTFPLAFASWHLVERPALSWKNLRLRPPVVPAQPRPATAPSESTVVT
jgi:peptidoglycan/LPS O-acetylase OafA/YrhL